MFANSLLFKGNITLKRVHCEDDQIILESDPSDSLPGSFFVTPGDVVSMIKLSLTPSVIGYIVLFPFYYLRWTRRKAREVPT